MTLVGKFIPARFVFARRVVWCVLAMSANFVMWVLTFFLMVLAFYALGYA